MSLKKKFKRDYIILEYRDINFRNKERVVPKAYAKVEVNNGNFTIALYVENLRFVKEGYRVLAIDNKNEVIELGVINLSEQGKGEYTFNLDNDEIDIKAIAILHEDNIPLIGFKGAKIDNYEEILLNSDKEENEESKEDEEYYYTEYEYVEVDEYKEYETTEEVAPKEKTYEEVPREYKNIEKVYIKDDVINEEIQESKYMPGILLMPRQIKKGLKNFKEVKPFKYDYIKRSRWWKIDINPMTLCGYSMPNLGYVNSLNYTMYSDSIMQSYKYRHYLFGVQYDDYNRRKYYVYAVPGKKNEQPDKGLTGFTKYQCCDDKDESLGYWLCFIECKSRKILK